MKLEYNIVGVAKQSEEDLRTIYNSTRTGVFGLALAVTGSRKLAREIAVETFRRVKRFAGSFDTEMNGEYWIYDICMQLSRNSLRDPAVAELPMTRERVDNASSLLGDVLFGLDGDRGKMLVLKAATELRNSDIASLNGYYSGSAAGEIRRGIARTAEKDPSRDKKTLLRELRADIEKICPDLYDAIGGEEQTRVAHVSHEAMYLENGQEAFGGSGEEQIVAEREAQRKKQASSRRLRILLICGGVLLAAAVLVTVLIVSRHRERPEESPQDRSVQYGNTVNMCKAGDWLFYRGISGGIFRYNAAAGGAPEQIFAGTARELITDGSRLFFRGDKSKIYSLEFDGSGMKQLCERSGTTLTFAGGLLYFSGSDGIYAMPPEGVDNDEDLAVIYPEEVKDAPSRNCMVVTPEGRVLFSGGADKGIFEVLEPGGTKGLGLLYFDEAYYITLWDGKLLFDSKVGDGIQLLVMDIDRKKIAVAGLKYDVDAQGEIADYESGAGTPVLSYAAAYCTLGDRLFFEGYTDDGAGMRTNVGIYALKRNSDTPELLLATPETELHITEMFTDGSRLYCFYSDGEADGARRLISYALDDPGDRKVVFEGTRK
ncbi:MAG: hypothetical protein IJM24_02135 [Clostridia bacterium]|nr:hypothetical protein [Clostridia bacterium]